MPITSVRTDGSLLATGFNLNGPLGDGALVNQERAVDVLGLSVVAALAAGDRFSLAQAKDGKVWAWGANASGQRGVADLVNRPTPTAVLGLQGCFAGGRLPAQVAIDRVGNVWAWGSNVLGELGLGVATQRFRTPQQLPGGRPWGTSGTVRAARAGGR